MLNYTRKENECNVEFQLRTSFNNKFCGADVLQEIVNRKSDDEAWQTINSHIRLHHLGTGQALKVGDLYTYTWVLGRL